MILATTVEVVLPFIANGRLVFVSIVTNIALVLGICCCVNVLTCVLIVIWVAIRMESLAVNIVQLGLFLLLSHEILLLVDGKIIWFDIIVSSCRVWHSFKILIPLLKADPLFLVIVVGIEVLESSLIRNKLIFKGLVVLEPLPFLLVRKEVGVVVLVWVVNVIDKERSFLISETTALFDTIVIFLVVCYLFGRHDSRLTKAQSLFLRFFILQSLLIHFVKTHRVAF